MELNGGPEYPAVSAELTFSFAEELTATLHHALGVAAQIAVAQISGLLDRALRDAQGRIRDALRDNSALKFRLQTAETQLSVVCGRQDHQPPRIEDFPINSSDQLATNPPVRCCTEAQLNALNVDQQSERTIASQQDYDACKPIDTVVVQRGSGSGKKPRGGECAQTINSDSLEGLDETNDIKNNQHITKTNQAHAGTSTDLFEVAIKVKKEETFHDPTPVSLCVTEEHNSDSISLAQSRLLEDWRPEPLQPESDQSSIHCQSTSHPGGQYRTELDFLSSSISGQQNNLPRLHNRQTNPERHMFPPGRKRHHCSLCGRDFFDLKVHQRIHTGELPYTCHICNTRFRHALTLKRHLRLHTGEKPYVCGQCGKRFRLNAALKDHQCS